MNSPKTKLSGLQRVCRAHGRMKCGDTMMVWDYANECAVPESEMKAGSERWKTSERAKWMPEVPDVRSMTDDELSALPVLSLPTDKGEPHEDLARSVRQHNP